MPSPFETLGGKKPIVWEEIEGYFHCAYCSDIATDAKYLERETLITWKCSKGHVNKETMKL